MKNGRSGPESRISPYRGPHDAARGKAGPGVRAKMAGGKEED